MIDAWPARIVPPIVVQPEIVHSSPATNPKLAAVQSFKTELAPTVISLTVLPDALQFVRAHPAPVRMPPTLLFDDRHWRSLQSAPTLIPKLTLSEAVQLMTVEETPTPKINLFSWAEQ